MTSLEAWIRSNLPLHPSVLAHAVEQARGAAAGARMSEDAWCARLHADPRERERLVATVVPPETWLFRHAPAFECVRAHLRAIGSRRVRMLSLGCATGAEAFSLAATALACGREARDCEITAVDWSSDNLAQAADGTCAPRAQRGPLPIWAMRHFHTDRQGSLRLSPEGMSLIRWVQDDITSDRMPRACDVVFCRNVAIYLNEDARRLLAKNLAAGTREGGLLCLGHADPPAIWSGAFRMSSAPGAFACERAAVDSGTACAAPPMRRSAAIGSVACARTVEPATPSLSEAQALADAGALSEASAMLDRILPKHAVDAEPWHLRGSVHLALGERAQAEACFRKVVYLQPEHALALLQLSGFAEDRGDAAGAERLRARAARALKGDTT